jgi:NADH-quinone oxidoreductase subunit M
MAALRTPLLAIAIATIVLAAAAAFAQRDLKRVLAYSSINHLGYCLLAVFAVANPVSTDLMREQVAALNGAILQMFNHGLTAATLFALIAFLEERTGGRRGIDEFGGLRRAAPVFTGVMGIALFSSLGLPGLNGFVGEFLIFKGVFPLATCSATVSTLGLLITAVFILTILQRVFSGPLAERWSTFRDLNLRERLVVAPAIGLMFLLGVYPQCLVGLFNATATAWVEAIR